MKHTSQINKHIRQWRTGILDTDEFCAAVRGLVAYLDDKVAEECNRASRFRAELDSEVIFREKIQKQLAAEKRRNSNLPNGEHQRRANSLSV